MDYTKNEHDILGIRICIEMKIDERKYMTREKKILLSAILLAVTGWLMTAILLSSIGVFKLRSVNAESDAANWKRQAGKAYTELLKARAGVDSTGALIPKGARIDCTMAISTVDGRTVSKCENGTIYPPRDF